MIVTGQQMKAAEQAAFAAGVTPEGLMEIAGEGIAGCLRQFFPKSGTVAVFCGKGHNGGDALVAARHLLKCGWRILIRLAHPLEELAPLTRGYLDVLHDSEIVASVPELPPGSLLLLDGLLGIGSSGAPKGELAGRILEINRLRQERGAYTVAVDLPSGLDATTGEVFSPCVQADLTITLG